MTPLQVGANQPRTLHTYTGLQAVLLATHAATQTEQPKTAAGELSYASAWL